VYLVFGILSALKPMGNFHVILVTRTSGFLICFGLLVEVSASHLCGEETAVLLCA
jgi:hypothetical protein